MSPLHAACRAGDTERVKQLLDGDGGAHVDEKDEDGRTALWWASIKGHTEVVRLLLDKGALLDEKGEYGYTALMLASERGHAEVVRLLLDTMLKLLLEKGAPVDEKDKNGWSLLMKASMGGYTEVVRLLLDKGALLDEKDKDGDTALKMASDHGHTEVVRLLLDKGALLDEKNEYGNTALMWASYNGHTEVVRLLLDTMLKLLLEKGAPVDEKDKNGWSLLMKASMGGYTEVVRLLLDKGALLDEKNKLGKTALLLASHNGHTEVAKLLLDRGASVGVKSNGGNTALPTVVAFDEDQLGRMAAAQVHRYSLQLQGQVDDAGELSSGVMRAILTVLQPKQTAKAVVQLVRLAGFARDRARQLRSSDPRSADDHQALFGRLQLAAAACIQNDASGKARGEGAVQELFGSDDGRTALEHAVQIEAKELLAQPVVQGYIEGAWRGDLWGFAWAWVLVVLALLLQLLFVLPLVALVPPLDSLLVRRFGEDSDMFDFSTTLPQLGYYLLRHPVVKFGLECAADLALALALTLLPAADLATAPVAPLLLIWVGSGLLWEGRQLISAGSDAPGSRSLLEIATSVPDRLGAYWADHINRVDATALIFSFVALVAFVSAGDSGDPSATSLRVVAVFLLWLRTIRVLLVSPKFGPFVMMFFRMLFGDVLHFLVLLLILLVAFAASWTVLLEPQSSLIAGCADDLGGVEFSSTMLRLLESALIGDDYFECARDSTNSPVAAWVITFGYVTLTAVLLLNMLIAMMAKTFDNISEASDTNYLFLFAQRTLALQNELPTPPPLNALGLPCHALCLLRDLLQKKDGTQKTDGTASEATATKAFDFAEKIKPLAELVTEYILNHQDDAAEEEHWRTTMKRDIGKNFRIQHKKIDEQGIEMKQGLLKIDKQGIEMQQRFDDAHAKMDETIQLVKDLAKQHHFSC